MASQVGGSGSGEGEKGICLSECLMQGLGSCWGVVMKAIAADRSEEIKFVRYGQ